MALTEDVGSLLGTLIASVMLILLSVIYFGLTLWIVKTASDVFFGAGLEANWAVLSAALLSMGAIIAGGLGKY